MDLPSRPERPDLEYEALPSQAWVKVATLPHTNVADGHPPCVLHRVDHALRRGYTCSPAPLCIWRLP